MKAVAEEALKEFYIFTDSVWTDIIFRYQVGNILISMKINTFCLGSLYILERTNKKLKEQTITTYKNPKHIMERTKFVGDQQIKSSLIYNQNLFFL